MNEAETGTEVVSLDVGWLTSCKIARSGGVEFPIELSCKSLEGHWLTLLAFCLGLYKFLSRRAFTPFLASPNPKEKNREEKTLEGHLGEFCARKSFLVSKLLCSYAKTSFYFNRILK